MNDQKLFSKHYSIDKVTSEDGKLFRNRILKYLEDFVNLGWSHATYASCRSKMGIDIVKKSEVNRLGMSTLHYCVEDTFKGESVSQILDFITIVFDAYVLHPDTVKIGDKSKEFIREINQIFRDESICYILEDNGRVRYYPDKEFYQAISSTLVVLNKSKYTDISKSFSEVQEILYKNPNKESPIHEFFKCVEIFSLSLIKDKKYKILNDSSVDVLMNIIDSNIDADPAYLPHDKEATKTIRNIFRSWVYMCHKYRHGKIEQISNDVPSELFTQIFSTGISIFRYLLEISDKYDMISDNKSGG